VMIGIQWLLEEGHCTQEAAVTISQPTTESNKTS
jgi:hypothetical protein